MSGPWRNKTLPVTYLTEHFSRSAQGRENWAAQLHELGQFGQNQFFQFSELVRSIYGRASPAGQFWQMASALSWKFNMASAANLENKQTSNKAYRKTKY